MLSRVNLISSPAVVVTLVVLIVQLKQNTSEVRASTIQSLHEKSIDVFGETMLSGIPDILAKNKVAEPLTPAERETYIMFLRRNLQIFELVLMQHKQGRLSQEVMEAYNLRMQAHLSFSYWDEIWPELNPMMTKSFQEHMNKLGGT